MSLSTEQTRVVIAVIRTLGFVGNAHYCPWCMNHFHEDCGQHEPGCEGLSYMLANENWWDELTERLVPPQQEG